MSKSEAYLDGWLAHLKEVDGEDNPYDENKSARSYAQWTSGWCARHSAVKHDLELTYDDVEWKE